MRYPEYPIRAGDAHRQSSRRATLIDHQRRTNIARGRRNSRTTSQVLHFPKAAGKPIQLLVGEGYNHFEMLETLANPYGLLGRAMLAQMKLA
jgi:hypothetical protein